MKKVCLFVFIQCFFSLTLFAQYQLGVKGGVNHSTLFDRATTSNYQGDYKSELGFYSALNYKQRKSGLVNWMVELSFHQKVVSVDFFYGNDNFWIKKKMDYRLEMVHISLLPEFSIGNKTRLFLYFGPSFGWVVNSRVKGVGRSVNSLGKEYEWTEEGSGKADFNGPDLGLKTGLGIEVPISGRIKISAETQFAGSIVSLVSGSMEHYSDYIGAFDISTAIGLSFTMGKIINKQEP